MATVVRAPTSDEAVSGTWSGSAGSRYTLVDDYPDETPNDILTSPTAAGGCQITFGFSAFSIPAGSTGISVQVMYRDDEASSGNNNCGGRLKVGGNYYNAATHNPSTTATNRSDNWATNPKTTAAWTVAQINGTDGTNDLQAFGINSSDANPSFFITGVQIQVTYLPPITGTLNLTLGSLSSTTAAAVIVAGVLSASLDAATLSATGTVSDTVITGTLSQTLGDLTLSSSANAVISGTMSLTLGDLSLGASGDVPIQGNLSRQLDDVTASATGNAVINGELDAVLEGLFLTATNVFVPKRMWLR